MREPAGYRQAVEGAAVADRRDRGRLAVGGADRRTFLHALLTQDIQTLAPGQGRYAAYLTAQGRMIADMMVYETGEAALLDLPPGLAGPLAERFDALVFSEDVRLGNVSDEWSALRVVGPEAAPRLAAVLAALHGAGGDVPDATKLAGLAEQAMVAVSVAGTVVRVAATAEWGLPAFDLYAERATADAIRSGLLAAGVAELSGEAAEALRVEAGTPQFFADLDTGTIPLEAGIESRAISFTKGCYPGQEVIIRVVHRGGGRVARRLVGLRVEGEDVPQRGGAIRAGGADAGTITSAVWSPSLGGPIALGYLRRESAEPGTPVEVVGASGTSGGRVVRLPFVSRRS